MHISSRRGTIVFFLCLGIGLVALAIALNVGWIILNWREGVLLFFGIVFFALIIAGMVVNTIFLVRELRRSERHDSFINAVTHELKTPVASIRLHLETLQRREVAEQQKEEFYRLRLSDTERIPSRRPVAHHAHPGPANRRRSSIESPTSASCTRIWRRERNHVSRRRSGRCRSGLPPLIERQGASGRPDCFSPLSCGVQLAPCARLGTPGRRHYSTVSLAEPR